MYDDYEVVESWKKAKKLLVNYKAIGWRKIDSRTFKKIETEVSKLKSLHGKDFLEEYGWASTIIKPRNFSMLEKHAGIDHFRFFYSWACDNVHSGVSGVRKRLGLMENDNRILMGPSNFGIADPAQFTSYSLLEMTRCFLAWNDSIKNKISAEIIEELHSEIVGHFSTVHKSIIMAELQYKREERLEKAKEKRSRV